MKVLLIQPPLQEFDDVDDRFQPIDLCYLKAAVKKHHPEIEVKVIDFHHGCGKHVAKLPEELAYLNEYYPYEDNSPFCGVQQFCHFGAKDKEIIDAIKKEAPDVIVISSLFSLFYREVLHTAALVKKIGNIPVVASGSHVSQDPLSLLTDQNIDFVICGEGEKPLVEFLRALKLKGLNTKIKWSHIPNLGFQKASEYFINIEQENFPIQEIPVPDLSDFKVGGYGFDDKPMAVVFTSRGCSFSFPHKVFGRKFRKRTVEDVLAEIKLRYEQGFRVISFEDDDLTYDKDFLRELCHKIIDEYEGKDLELVALKGVSCLSLDPELLQLMCKAGFSHLNVALVTTDSLEKYSEVINVAADLDFKIKTSQVNGFSAESLENIIETLSIVARLPVLTETSLTDFCKSDDLYTLHITSRIIDFIKSLPVDQFVEDMTVAKALKVRGLLTPIDDRIKIGLELLNDLFNDRVLYALTPHGKKPLNRFKFELFEKVWARLDKITTLNQLSISI